MIQLRGIGRSRGTSLTAIVVALGLCACDGPASEAASPESVDSLGITVVENTVPSGDEQLRWQLSSQPGLSIGVADGPPEVTLSRVVGAFRLKDDRIVIADGGSRSLRFFDVTGAHLRTVGREGGGPGEFMEIGAISRFAGDSLAAWDPKSYRLSIHDTQGEFIRAVTLPPLGLGSRLVGALADGLFVIQPGVDPYQKMAEKRSGEYRDSVSFLYFAPDGSPFDTVGPFPGPEMFVSERGVVTMYDRVNFGRDFRLAVGRSRLYGGDTDTYAINVLDRDGTTDRLIRRSHTPVAVLDRHRSAARAAEDAEREFADLPPAMRAAFETANTQRPEIPTRRTFPAFAALLEDTERRLWVSDYPRPGEPSVRWSVFDGEGRWEGAVDLPANARILDAGADYVLLLETDELDVELVTLYRLEEID